jgi:DHA2 family multidrug resistance protein
LQAQGGDPALVQEMRWTAIADMRAQQASAMAYFDCYAALALLSVCLALLVLLMRRSVAGEGEHVVAE